MMGSMTKVLDAHGIRAMTIKATSSSSQWEMTSQHVMVKSGVALAGDEFVHAMMDTMFTKCQAKK